MSNAFFKERLTHKMKLPNDENIEIKYLNRLFDNTSECYKFFWFQAIVTKVLDGKQVITYEELVDEMIADAWYMVTEYHLNLGPNDTLEKIINYIKENMNFKPSEKKEVILKYLADCTDKEVNTKKRVLTKNVPYRLQAPFMENFRGNDWSTSEKILIGNINKRKHLIYYFSELQGMSTQIKVEDTWVKYIHVNQEIIKGWLQYHMITYLQKRNPNVPGIVDKLYPPQQRNLERVKKYWKIMLDIKEIREIYGDEILTPRDISIDHFVPWSFVAHDELWNLHPTTKRINSAKSNGLPDWDKYFPRLAKLEYSAYELMWDNETLHKAFDRCAREHLNNFEIQTRIYKKGQSELEFTNVLEDIISPVYNSAKNCGFNNWQYKELK